MSTSDLFFSFIGSILFYASFLAEFGKDLSPLRIGLSRN
jgi:hypothetical protein